MTDKDKKLIREMASDMDYACTKHDLWPEDAEEIAKILSALGYRKIKEDDIIISKKEYEDSQDLYKNFDNYLFEFQKFATNRIKEIRQETATDWHKIIIDRLKELWKGRILTTKNYNALVDYFDKVLKLYDDNKEEI